MTSAGRSSPTASSWPRQPNGAPTWFPCNDHPSAQGHVPHRVRVRLALRRRGDRAPSSRPGCAAAAPAGSSSSTTRWRPTSRPSTSGATCGAAAGPAASRSGVVLPASERDRRARPRAPARDDGSVRVGSSAPTRSSDYTVVVTADDLEIPLEAQGLATFGAELARRAPTARAARRPRAGPPVVRQQPHPAGLGRHLAPRGVRLLRRVALVRARRRGPGRRRAPRRHWSRLAAAAAGPRPRRTRGPI